MCAASLLRLVRAGWVKSALVLALVLVGTAVSPQPAYAFKAGAHLVLEESVRDTLPKDSVFRMAMEQYPYEAAWGSFGADIGYGDIGPALNYSPYADMWHDDRAGSMGKKLVQYALQSGDMREIAFAAGWVTHMTGDYSCHGHFTNPDLIPYLESMRVRTGVYFDQPRSGGDFVAHHQMLEAYAEPYVWQVIGRRSASTYTQWSFPNNFSSETTVSCVAAATNAVYGVPGPDMRRLSRFHWNVLRSEGLRSTLVDVFGFPSVMNPIADFLGGLGFGDAYLIERAGFYGADASVIGNDAAHSRVVSEAFDYAKLHAVALLEGAEARDYHGFTDTLALDVGVFEMADPPAQVLTLNVKTGTAAGAGTDDNMWVRFQMADGTVIEKELGFGDGAGDVIARRALQATEFKSIGDGADDFESGDNDTYLLYLDPTAFKLENVHYVGFRKGPNGVAGRWLLDSWELRANGVPVKYQYCNQWFSNGEGLRHDWPTGRVDAVGTFPNIRMVVTPDSDWRNAMAPPPVSGLSGASIVRGSRNVVRLSWNPLGSANVNRIIVLRKSTWYAIMSPFDVVNGKLLLDSGGSAVEVIDDTVEPVYWTGSQRDYAVFTLNRYNIWNRANVHVDIQDRVPPPEVSNLTALPGNASVALTWRNPASKDWYKTEVWIDDGTPVPLRSPACAVATGLASRRRYTFVVRTKDEAGNYSPGVSISSGANGTVSMDAPPLENVRVTRRADHSVSLAWDCITPDPEPVRILRSPYGFTESPEPSAETTFDAFGWPKRADQSQYQTYEGTGTAWTDEGLLFSHLEDPFAADFVFRELAQPLQTNGVNYYYSIFVRDSLGNWVAPSFIQARTLDTAPPRSVAGGVGYPELFRLPFTPLLGVYAPWVNHPVTLSVSAEDTGSGVANIYCRLDGGVRKDYSDAGSLVVSSQGAHSFEYWAVDKAGNTEAVLADDGGPPIYADPIAVSSFAGVTTGSRSSDFGAAVLAERGHRIYFRIDTIPPVSSATIAPSYSRQATITIGASDVGSGLGWVNYELDGEPGTMAAGESIVVQEPGRHTLRYWASDLAGCSEPAHQATFVVNTSSTLLLNGEDPPSRTEPMTLTVTAWNDCDGSPIAGEMITLEESTTSGWLMIDEAKTDQDGVVQFAATPTEGSIYRARFDGCVGSDSAMSAPLSADLPFVKAKFGALSAPKSVRANTLFSMNGRLSPSHAPGTEAARILIYRKSGKKWVYSKTAIATCGTTTSGWTDFSCKTKMTRVGTYRLRFMHTDAGHAAVKSGWYPLKVR